MNQGFVYIMANNYRTVLYVGVTNHLYRRVLEHKDGVGSRFTSKYNCNSLIYFEFFWDIRHAISREKQIKNWKREWKIDLIKNENPDLKDLAKDWY